MFVPGRLREVQCKQRAKMPVRPELMSQAFEKIDVAPTCKNSGAFRTGRKMVQLLQSSAQPEAKLGTSYRAAHTTRITRTSMTLVCVRPVLRRSPVAAKKG